MSTPKTTPKKLRGGPTIAVDEQIIRWRRRMDREGIVLGKASVKAKKKAEYDRKARATDSNEKITKKRWF